jgi:glucose/arabinose dehydrogenase
VRGTAQRAGWALLAALISVLALLVPASASAGTIAAPTITEPSTDGQLVSSADVHMEAGGFSDTGDATHAETDWEIWTVDSPERIWSATAGGAPLNVHIHLGDGQFEGSYAGDSSLAEDTAYQLRVRFHDSDGDVGPYATRDFRTYPPNPPGTPGDNPWAVKQPGYVVQKFVSGLQLPVNIAFVPNPGPNPSDPLLYVTELYGTIKMVTRDGRVSDYASGLLNYPPTGAFPGSGEQGLTGIVVDPQSGDVFASLVYADTSAPDPQPHYGEVLRFHSVDGGRTASSATQILDLAPDETGPSHQISNLTIGPDGKLYVHNGEGFNAAAAENVDSFLGKILRVNLDGTAPSDNPLYDGPPITARDYVFARGFRNPFGGVWRASNGAHYEVENGPAINDRVARMDLPAPPGGYDFGWEGDGDSMLTGALYTWSPTHAPVNIAFIQPETFSGSGFPADQMDHAFITESGPTYAEGPQPLGKRIVELDPGSSGEIGSTPARPLVEYDGVGYATAVGLAAGPGGLYFTDLYKDVGAAEPSEAGANIWRVCYQACAPLSSSPGGDPSAKRPKSSLKDAKRHCRRKFRGKKRARCIKRAKKKARTV